MLFQNRTIVKSVRFGDYRMIGDPTTVARVFNQRNADELVFLDILASRNKEPPNFQVLENIAEECFMPLTIGGGIRKLTDVDRLFRIGADKISVNAAAVERPEIITEVAKKYGSQAVVVSIDAKKTPSGHKAFILGGTKETGYSPAELAMEAEKLGAGEIMLNSIDRDGMMNGYDIELIKQVSESISIPLIALGGCGKLQDFVDAVKLGGADAVSGASIFYFVGESIITARDYMNKQGLPVRML